MMKAAKLTDRGVVRLAGPEAASFLNGLVTSDVGGLRPGEARFAALLTPQGKIVADFLVAATDDGLLLDCPRDLAAPLAQKLGFYKLRAKVTVANLSDSHSVVALWYDGLAAPRGAFIDPRDANLGCRAIVAAGAVDESVSAFGATRVSEDAYEAHRIACGVAKGGVDFAYNDAFPHETNMDRIGGVDFGKGCYVGQEVVSRIQHRGTARTRVVRVAFDGAAPHAGTDVTAGGKPVGTMGSSSGQAGLAMLRLDRVADALAASQPLQAGSVALRVDAAALEMPVKRTVA